MATKHVAHWLGSPVNQLPQQVQDACHSCFTIIEHGQDVSILSEANIHYSLFFLHGAEYQELLLTALRICVNLNKYLVIIHDGNFDKMIHRNDVIFATMDITQDDPLIITDAICEKLSLKFSSSYKTSNLRSQSLANSSQNMSKEMQEILRHIELNLTQDIREEDVASYCHYSISYFSKLFKKMVGVSFRDYICSKRITLAKRLLLEEPNAKIAFVAYQCGYHDVSYFSRIFKKKTGISPGLFRQVNVP
ncbi:helix-turn-helix domain-containing protein [Vibrio ziniensis]|uniref:Helix-turn-helix transcriptional regulator n=1 Tax=Vibrio ziniensis TaxID=2711221 RepID=A0A6G7CG03_9VIBR|nr:AraC family transcriptional regulator [Vibrio ziniensis]QIH40968.1 helix-turn-helix transcriptional regulator [Vibrio ziniensis]